MATPRSRKTAGQPTGGQFAVEARSETDVQLHAPADPSIEVTVPNPDDPFDMPIYEGPAAGATGRLVPGSYTAYGLDDETPYLLTVPDPGAIEWTEHPDGSRTAVVEGIPARVTLLHPEDDPEDATSWQMVVFEPAGPATSGTFRFDFDSGLWEAVGHAKWTTREDSADLAVRALALHAKRTVGRS